jgi:hypothetical protein
MAGEGWVEKDDAKGQLVEPERLPKPKTAIMVVVTPSTLVSIVNALPM